jgi:amino acid adenylation domain-containing protein
VRLHRYVLEAAARHPDRPAVIDALGIMPYAELSQQANRAAHVLRKAGVRPGDRVVIWLEKSADAIIAMQAVLRLGAAYVPADGATPARRVIALARHCSARAVCTTSARLPSVMPDLEPGTECIDISAATAPAARPAEVIDHPTAPDDLAYILYTSGSTGEPKGVCISHRNACAFIDWAVQLLSPDPADRFASHAPFTFDLSVLDLYACFATAASVHLVPAELAYAPEQLAGFLYEHEITIWYSVPSALGLMIRQGGLLDRAAPPDLRAVLFAGEPFPIGDVRELAAWTKARLFNLYGPTETNVCTYHEVTADDLRRDRPVPIGMASSGDTVFAEKPNGSVADVGEEGELLVDGPTVMLGYWGKPPQQGPYRTGDVVRVLPGARYDYVGRRDHLVKVRGHRIELGEVEAALVSHAAVAETAAVVAGSGLDTRLAAYVVPANGRTPGVLELKRHMAQTLPRYMIADELHVVTKLPRTANGKVDRRTLALRSKSPAEVT